jgi:hypothetical protein
MAPSVTGEAGTVGTPSIRSASGNRSRLDAVSIPAAAISGRRCESLARAQAAARA